MLSTFKDFKIYRSLRENHIRNIKIQMWSVSTSEILPKISRAINKYLYKIGIGCAINRYENNLVFYSSSDDKKLYEKFSTNDLFCNFGSGSFYHNRWLNFDYPGQSKYYKSLQGVDGVDFHSIDLCEKDLTLPLETESVSLIYCSHTLEHLEEAAAVHFLAECYRALKHGGVLRIAVPSTDNHIKIAEIIMKQDSIPDEVKKKVCMQVGQNLLADSNLLGDDLVYDLFHKSNFKPVDLYASCVEVGVDNKFKPSNPERHITFFDYEKLSKISGTLGYSCCLPLYRGASMASPFENITVFDNTEAHISLYVEFIK